MKEQSRFAIDSVVVAVPNLDEAMRDLSATLDARFGAVRRVEALNVETAWAPMGGASLQVIAPTGGGEAPISSFLNTRGGIYGVTLRVPDLAAEVKVLGPGGLLANNGEVIDAGYAKEALIRPSRTARALFVLREWS